MKKNNENLSNHKLIYVTDFSLEKFFKLRIELIVNHDIN